MVGLYGISSHCLNPIADFAEQAAYPVLVFIHVQKNFHEYTCTVDINDPFGESNILTAVSRGISTDRSTAQNLAQRRVFHYYPDTGEFTQYQRDKPDPELEIP